jgi:hypothetical protein
MASLSTEDDGGQYNLILTTNGEQANPANFDANNSGTRSATLSGAMKTLQRITDYGSEVKTEEEVCDVELDGFHDWLCVGKIKLADGSSMWHPKGVEVLLLRMKDSSN